MQLSEGTIFQILVYIVSGAATVSTILYRIKTLEKKVEKHNSLVEAMIRLEQSCKSAHHRIDRLDEIVETRVR